MHGDTRSTTWEWQEGNVDQDASHMKLAYGDSDLAVALVAKPVGNTFVVEFLQLPELDKKEYERIKLVVTKELTFYLVEKGEKTPGNMPYIIVVRRQTFTQPCIGDTFQAVRNENHLH